MLQMTLPEKFMTDGYGATYIPFICTYTISKKVQSFVNCFSALDRWSKKKRGEAFLQKEKEFMSTIDEIFDVFCADDKQRRILEKQHGLKMTDDDYAFYKDQTSKRVGKCVDAVVPSTSADIQFLRRSRPLQPHPEPPTCSSGCLSQLWIICQILVQPTQTKRNLLLLLNLFLN